MNNRSLGSDYLVKSTDDDVPWSVTLPGLSPTLGTLPHGNTTTTFTKFFTHKKLGFFYSFFPFVLYFVNFVEIIIYLKT